MIKIADITLGQIIHTDLNEPLDVTNKGLHVHTSTGENVDLATFLTNFNTEDFATQVTLAALNTAFGNEDFSSETTLASVLTKLTELDNKIDAISNADNMNVTQVGSNAVGGSEVPEESKRSGTLNPATTEIVLDINNKPLVIDNIDFGTDNNIMSRIKIARYDSLGNVRYINYSSSSGTATANSFSIASISETGGNGKNSIFVLKTNNPSGTQYAMSLIKNIKCPFGAKIEIYNSDGVANHNIACVVGCREMEVI